MRSLTNTLKQFGGGLISQSRKLWKALFALYLPIGLLFVVVGAWSRVSDDVSLTLFMRDVVTTGRLPFYAGFVSQVEAILWSASLAVCLLTLSVVRRQADYFAGSTRFLRQAGILTGLLLVDDIFLFHGEIAPKFLNINKQIVFAGYLVIAVMIVSSNWKEILSSEYLILLLALGMFSASISFDALSKLTVGLPRIIGQFTFFFEDGIKFAGTATWLTYFVRYSLQQFDRVSMSSDSSQSRV